MKTSDQRRADPATKRRLVRRSRNALQSFLRMTDQAKVGIFAGSLISAVVGSGVLLSGRRLTGHAEIIDR